MIITTFSQAAHVGHADIVTLLGKYGADTWCISGLQRNTALMRAAQVFILSQRIIVYV